MTIRLYPSRLQSFRLTEYLNVSRSIFNRCLAIKRRLWQDRQFSLSRFDLTKVLTLWRATEDFVGTKPTKIQRDAIRRVDLAFQHFFRRVKEKTGKAGYPRFKAADRYNSFTINDPGKVIRNGRIRVSGIPTLFRCRNLRPVDGKIKQLRILRKADRWFAQLVIEKPDVPIQPRVIRKTIGLDLGLNAFVYGSDGMSVPCPKFYRKLERHLRSACRHVSRKKKGSANRRQAVRRLQRIYLKIADSRMNFTHHLSKQIVADYDLIAVEKLNVKGMTQGRLSKSVLDAAWYQFTSQLRYKAEEAGTVLCEVNPRGTSQECSGCGEIVQKSLSVRVHKYGCGLVLDRDENAARNILQRAIDSLHPAPVGGSVMPAENSREFSETGSILQ